MQAKKITNPVIYESSDKYELFDNIITKDINGVDVTIPKSVGIYSIVQLQGIIDKADSDKVKAQNKIDAINALK